jgi:hypothetical protein
MSWVLACLVFGVVFEPFFYVNVTIEIQLKYLNTVLNWVDLINSIGILQLSLL